MTSRWIEDGERSRTLRPYADMLWNGRDDAVATPGQVSFGSCRYVPVRHMHPDDEFAMATSLLTDGVDRMEMPYRRDCMVVAYEAVVAWKVLAALTSTTPVLPSSVEIVPEAPAEPPRPSIRASIARMLGIRKGSARSSRRTISTNDPRDIVRYELARILERIAREDGSVPSPGSVIVPLRGGLTLDMRDMVLTSAEYGQTTVHAMCRRRIADTIRGNEQAGTGR